ncbi:MAG: hypothetical protein V7L25_08295 [Nostoc sp.]
MPNDASRLFEGRRYANKSGNHKGSSSWGKPPLSNCRRSNVANAALTPRRWLPNVQYFSTLGCALSVAMPQALRQLLETLLRSLSTSAQCAI